MALAIMFENDDVMFLDVVTNYSKTRASTISNHPVDASATITDHISKNNPVFSVRAIVSAADFHTTYTRPSEILNGGENNPAVGQEYDKPVENVTFKDSSSLLDLLPGSVQQFLDTTGFASIELDPFRGYTHQIARDRLEQCWEDSEIISILDYDFDISTGRSVSVKLLENCVMERYEDLEDVDTGDSLVADMTFRQVRFAAIKEVDVEITQTSPATSASPSEEVSDDSASKEDMGEVSGEEVEREYAIDWAERELNIFGTGGDE